MGLILMDVYALLGFFLSLIFIAAVRYPNRCIGTIDRPDLPGPRGAPVVGNLLLVFRARNTMLALLSALERRYGPLFTFTLPGWGRNIMINRPEWLEHMRQRESSGARRCFWYFDVVPSAYL